MKKAFFTGLLLSAALVLFGDPAPELEVYSRMYDDVTTAVQKLEVLKTVVEAEKAGTLSEAETFYARALNQLVARYSTIQGNQNVDAADSIAQIVSERLGELKYEPAKTDLLRVVNSFPNSLVRSGAMIALSKIPAPEYLPQVVKILADLNSLPSADRQEGERLAYGAITALGNYKDISGYIPVFFASRGWYSDRTRSLARETLPNIAADPSESLISVIKNPGYTYEERYTALQVVEASSVSEEKKAAAAVTGLSEGWRAATADPRQRMILTNIRKLSINMIREYGTEDPAVYPLLEKSYNDGIDEEERLGAVSALSVLASNDSVRLLSAFIVAMNVRLQDGTLTQGDERTIRALIPALGATGNSDGALALRSVQNTSWTNAVKRLAATALKNISDRSK
ncbi:hypothetical protein FACS189473_2760 [Spirochaetia bacterium]|nr:hypothetical protein FACS189473_2760 [Spirochaetia bacterium]